MGRSGPPSYQPLIGVNDDTDSDEILQKVLMDDAKPDLIILDSISVLKPDRPEGSRTIRYLKSDVEQFLAEYRKEWPTT